MKLWATLALTPVAFAAQAAPRTGPVQLERQLHGWVQSSVGSGEDAHEARYSHALTDLSGDGAPEALVYLGGPYQCGSGGCNLYILQRNSGAWRLINSVTIAKLPIRRLATSSRGWSDIGVYVQGGGSFKATKPCCASMEGATPATRRWRRPIAAAMSLPGEC